MGYIKLAGLGYFGSGVGLSATIFLGVMLKEKAGYGPEYIGFFMSAFELSLLTLMPLTLFFIDRFGGLRWILLLYVLISMTLLFLACSANDAPVIAAFVVLFQFVLAPCPRLWDRAVLHALGKGEAEKWGVYRLAQSVLFGAGAPACAALRHTMGWIAIPIQFAVGYSLVCIAPYSWHRDRTCFASCDDGTPYSSFLGVETRQFLRNLFVRSVDGRRIPYRRPSPSAIKRMGMVLDGYEPSAVIITRGLTPDGVPVKLPFAGVPDVTVNVTLRRECTRNHMSRTVLVILIGEPVLNVVLPPSSVSTIVGFVSVGQVNRNELALSLVVCAVLEDTPLPRYNSPLGLSSGRSPLRFYTGAVWGNILTIAAPLFLQMLFVLMMCSFSGRKKLTRAMAFTRFPSLLMISLLFVQQSTVSFSVLLLVQGSQPGDYGAGVVGCFFSLVLCVALWIPLRASNFEARYVPEGAKASDLLATETARILHAIGAFLYGSGKWYDVDPSTEFKQRHNFHFTDYTSGCRWFIVIEMAMNVVCGVVQGLIQPDACISLLFVTCIAFFFFAVIAIAPRPYTSVMNTVFSCGMILSQLVSAESCLLQL
jgi:hypothetical protein